MHIPHNLTIALHSHYNLHFSLLTPTTKMPSPCAVRTTIINSVMYSESMREKESWEEPEPIPNIPYNNLMKVRDHLCHALHKAILDKDSKFSSTYEIFYNPDFQGQFEVRARKLMKYTCFASEFAMNACITIGFDENDQITAKVSSLRYMNSAFTKVDVKVHSMTTFQQSMSMTEIAAIVVAEAMQL